MQQITTHPINEQLAQSAHEQNHFGDYRKNSATDHYNDLITQFQQAVSALIEKNKKQKYPATADQMELVAYYCERYSAKLAEAINKENQIEASCPSVLISGAANFPVRKKERQNAARKSFWEKYGDLFEPTENYYYDKIKNILTSGVVYSNDDLAIEKLENKLQEKEELREEMKARNAYYRKHGTMKDFEGMTDAEAERIDNQTKNGWGGALHQPYPEWSLGNLGAEIRRIKERIEQLKKLKAEAEIPAEDKYPTVAGVTVKENAQAMRIQLFFDDKPDEATRATIKQYGFRWSPSFGAWQRQLTGNGKSATRELLKALAQE